MSVIDLENRIAGSRPGPAFNCLSTALGPVFHRDVVILAHKVRLPDAGEWKHPEDIVNDVQQAVSKDLQRCCTTIRLVTGKTSDMMNDKSRS